MTTRSLLRAAAALVLTVIGVIIWPSGASAHAGDQSYLYLDVTQTSVGGRVEAPIRDLNTGLGLELGGSDAEIVAGLEANFDLIVGYLGDHLGIAAGGESWEIEFTESELFFSDLPEADDNYVLFFFTATPTVDPVPRELEVTFDPFFDEIPGRDALLLIGNDWQAGVIDNGFDVLAGYDSGSRTQTIDLGETSRFKNLVESVKLGLDHIRSGPDHILFVLVLILPAVLIFSGGWQPARSFGASLWRILKIVTMFTIAHSITFTLAGLDILPLPSSRIIESIIALSIVAAALHNIRPLAANKEWLIAFAFGLFHGMGFASLVSGLDVDRATQLISLLGRNIGIEIGQSIVVVLLFPALFFLRRTRYYQPFLVGVSGLLALISFGWLIERSLEVDLGVTGLVEPIVAFPRVLIWIAVLSTVSYGLHRHEGRRGRLLPVAGQDDVVPAKALVSTS